IALSVSECVIESRVPAAVASAAGNCAGRAAARRMCAMALLGIPADFILFGLTLIGVALFHNKTLQAALTGLASIVLYKLVFTGFKFGPGLGGLALHMQHEAVILTNLFLLLM